MKSRTCITAMILFATLAIAVRLSAQHTRYKILHMAPLMVTRAASISVPEISTCRDAERAGETCTRLAESPKFSAALVAFPARLSRLL
jgi:hypothetical protein